MTEVRYTVKDDGDGVVSLRLYAAGHSELYEKGVDIGCRVMSAFISALVNAADCEVNIVDKYIDVRSASATVAVTAMGDGTLRLRGAYELVVGGIEALAERYPENFRVEQCER